MISTAPLTHGPGAKPKHEEVEVFLAVHHVEDPHFAKIVQETSEHLAVAARLGAPQSMPLMQELLWQNAEFDRLAITRYLLPDEKGRLRFLRLGHMPRNPELLSHIACGVLSLQTAQTLNTELWKSCHELEGRPGGQAIRARAVFLSGGILVIPKEDLDFEASLRVPGELGFKSTKDGGPAPLGIVLVPRSTSEDEQKQTAEMIEATRRLLQADLDLHILMRRYRLVTRPGRTVS